jgi:multicomponent Na+:H+ antiporter subunit D
LTPEPPEGPAERSAATPVLVGVAGVAVALGLVASLVPGLQQRTEKAADRFRDSTGYAHLVLHGIREPATPHLPFTIESATTASWVYGLGCLAVALATAAFGLWRHRLPDLLLDASHRVLRPPVEVLRAAHSGIVGDYLLWITVGTGVLGGIWAFTLR